MKDGGLSMKKLFTIPVDSFFLWGYGKKVFHFAAILPYAHKTAGDAVL